MNKLRNWLVTNLPWLGVVRRRFWGHVDQISSGRRSYAQHGEDAFLWEELKGFDLSKGAYVDVGANHPTRISNTYLFYRQGLSGVTVEPNQELARLHRRFRPRDTMVSVGCGRTSHLAMFEISKAPVLSRFSNGGKVYDFVGAQVWRREYVPVLTLDAVIGPLEIEWIYLLSIDVEGMDLDVLAGADETLSKTYFVCVEANDEAEKASICSWLEDRQFQHRHTLGCNLIFQSTREAFNTYQTQAGKNDR